MQRRTIREAMQIAVRQNPGARPVHIVEVVLASLPHLERAALPNDNQLVSWKRQ